MKRYLTILIPIFISAALNAQEAADILRFSQSINSGTARFVSMGGAFGALGADFTSLSHNPAGLGVYRSSEFTITPSIKSRISDTQYLNNDYSDYKTRFNLDNFGFVVSFKSIKDAEEEEEGLVMVNLGFGYNRLNDFYGETTAYGDNFSSSIMDYFAGLAQGTTWQTLTSNDDYDPFINSNAQWAAIMAWNSFLIDTVPGSDNSYWAALNDGEGVYQDHSFSTIGGKGEYTFSIAANFSNNLFLGATIGLQNIYYKIDTYYTESELEGNQPLPNGDQFESLNYNQSLTIDGNGLNLKAGAIYWPLPELKVGLAAHTPTYYNLSERYRANMNSVFAEGTASNSTPLNLYDYKIETPYKLIGSLAYTFGSTALISFDYEYLDYSAMRFGKGGDGSRFTKQNNDIKDSYTNTYNLKAGTEFWLGKLALRAGYAYYGSPFKENTDFSSSAINVLSGGFGLRIDNLFIDWAYQRYYFNDSYAFYFNSPVAEREVSQNKFLLTVGYKF